MKINIYYLFCKLGLHDYKIYDSILPKVEETIIDTKYYKKTKLHTQAKLKCIVCGKEKIKIFKGFLFSKTKTIWK